MDIVKRNYVYNMYKTIKCEQFRSSKTKKSSTYIHLQSNIHFGQFELKISSCSFLTTPSCKIIGTESSAETTTLLSGTISTFSFGTVVILLTFVLPVLVTKVVLLVAFVVRNFSIIQ